ncbi:hypothetical protein [Streptomyces swartbergensis]|uniref:Uncharacterized protein n=1 Tax=Streptomyces swartbergensis TaxID=487165 RepID=A0A243S6K5_9ACTN|nr:hypothetical protein [Streptomyces swartbergensis]OUD02581.1 hypothetical protein CA983_14240 [Streptomyces swartbergensis]
MPALFVSFMRTAVPFIAGWLLTLAVRAGVEIDSATVTGFVTVTLGVAYYLAFRLLEWLGERSRGTALQTFAGVLLGWARPPSYPKVPVLEPVARGAYLDPGDGVR